MRLAESVTDGPGRSPRWIGDSIVPGTARTHNHPQQASRLWTAGESAALLRTGRRVGSGGSAALESLGAFLVEAVPYGDQIEPAGACGRIGGIDRRLRGDAVLLA